MAGSYIKDPLGLLDAAQKVAPTMEKALNNTKKTVDDIAACAADIKIQMFFELGDGLKHIAGDEGFSACVKGAAQSMLEVARGVGATDVFGGDETVQASVKKAVAALEKVIALSDSTSKNFPKIEGKTAEGAELSEGNKERLVSDVKKLSDIRKEFIMDLAGGVSKIQDIDYQNTIRSQCRKIEDSCNTLCGQMSKHNKAMDQLGINANSMKTDVAKNLPQLSKLQSGSQTGAKSLSKMKGKF